MAFNTSETWWTVWHAYMLSTSLKGRLLPAIARFSQDEELAVPCKKLHGRDRRRGIGNMERRGATRFRAQRKKWYLSQAHGKKSGSILL